jgi:hypothetical protein
MSTATTNPAETLKAFLSYEKAWGEKSEEAHRLAAEYGEARRRILGLLERKQRLIHNQPELVDHQGNPVSKDNEVSKLNAEILAADEEIGGGLNQLELRLDHARKLEERAKGAAEAFARSHLDLIVEARQAEGEADRERAEAKLAEAREEAHRYLDAARRTEGIRALAGATDRKAPAFDAGSELVRALELWQGLPSTTELR